MNRYRQSSFLTSANALSQLPPDEGHEIAFAGRSNAGKSSAINTLVEQTGLARTSKTPGRTQLINFFRVDDTHRLVDLPGYGYAEVPESVRRHWQALLARYLETRQSLRGVVVIMDVRHPLTEHDRALLDFCSHYHLPAHVLLTKADKLNRGPATAALQQVLRVLAKEYPETTAQLFSSLAKTGVDEALARLDEWMEWTIPAPEA